MPDDLKSQAAYHNATKVRSSTDLTQNSAFQATTVNKWAFIMHYDCKCNISLPPLFVTNL